MAGWHMYGLLDFDKRLIGNYVEKIVPVSEYEVNKFNPSGKDHDATDGLGQGIWFCR